MSTEQKKKMEDWFTWISRGAIICLLSSLLYRFDTMESNVQELVSEKKVMAQRVVTVETELLNVRNQITDIFKNYDLKPKR